MITKLPDLAYKILDQIAIHNSLTQEEIQKMLDVDSKSVKYAIRRLQENNIVQQEPDLLDMRTVNYRLPTPEEMDKMKSEVSPKLLSKLEEILSYDVNTHYQKNKEKLYT